MIWCYWVDLDAATVHLEAFLVKLMEIFYQRYISYSFFCGSEWGTFQQGSMENKRWKPSYSVIAWIGAVDIHLASVFSNFNAVLVTSVRKKFNRVAIVNLKWFLLTSVTLSMTINHSFPWHFWKTGNISRDNCKYCVKRTCNFRNVPF